MRIHSEENKGTSIDMYFPVTNVNVKKERSDCQALEFKGTETILIVDDEEDLLSITKILLEGMGYKVYEFVDPNEAFEFYRKNTQLIDVVLTDQTMPRMLGTELSSKIKCIEPSQKIILFSGYLSNEMHGVLHRIGVDAFVEKPFTVFSLGEALRKQLDKPAQSLN